MAIPSSEVTRLIGAMREAEHTGARDQAFNEVFALVYDELYRQAHRQRAGWNNVRTLNTTALVHEAYAKLVDGADVPFESQAHLLAVAAKAMRQILLDYAKAQRAQKRGGDRNRVTLENDLAVSEDETTRLLALDQALDRLEAMSPEAARIVECRFFGGMSVEETAEALDTSASTVKRRWRTARAWLHRELTEFPEIEDD